MITFVADNHYNAHPGAAIYDCIKGDYPISFHEDDWSCFSKPDFAEACDLLILNMIGDTCGIDHPGPEAELALKAYLEQGKDLLLLHGSSAAFWQWDWWRKMVGYRWVRPNDPDGIVASTHPKRPYKVEVSKTRHPLCAALKPMDLPCDEIYIELEQVGPTLTLMHTTTDEGTFPQCYECLTPFSGTILGFIPGHAPDATRHPDLIHNVKTLINYLQA
jgi:hypothetical protein